jgi:hypothetical protein
VFWPASLFYFQIYIKVQNHPTGMSYDIASDPILGPTAKLMRWAMETWMDCNDRSWPEGLPAPVPDPVPKSDLHVADELTYCALAFLLHHELEHIRLGHAGESEIDSERDADYAAAAWILDGVSENDAWFNKRILGIATALGTMTARGFYTRYRGGKTHPRIFDRLINTLDRHVRDENHQVWWMVITILSLHASNTNRTVDQPANGFTSARSCVDAFAEALSRE